MRRLYSDIEIKVSDPSISFCETVIETSSFKCTSVSANNKNEIELIAAPLDKGLPEEIESKRLDFTWE